MRFMIIVKATADSEAGVMPDQRIFDAMADYHQELQDAGVLLDAAGLQPSAKGWRIKYSGGTHTMVDGPFTETKELIAGYWLWQVKSIDEALEWARRCPDPMPGEDSMLEIRPVFEAEDFGKEYTPELQARDERLRAEIERQKKS